MARSWPRREAEHRKRKARRLKRFEFGFEWGLFLDIRELIAHRLPEQAYVCTGDRDFGELNADYNLVHGWIVVVWEIRWAGHLCKPTPGASVFGSARQTMRPHITRVSVCPT